MDEFDEDSFGFDQNSFGDPDASPEVPDFRATVLRSGTIRLVDWAPWMVSNGPLYTLLHARERAGVGIADLTIVRDEVGAAAELIVDFQCGDTAAHRAALAEWAARVSYQRLWLDGEIVELAPAWGGLARARCTGCGARLVDGKRGFWEFVRHRGAFPTSCVLCGSDLPQWTSRRQTDEDTDDSDARTTLRSTPCE
jgi:hypothetical protein